MFTKFQPLLIQNLFIFYSPNIVMKKSFYIDSCIYLNLWQREIDPKTGLKFWKIAKDFLQKIEDEDSIILYSGFVLRELEHILGNRFNNKNNIFMDGTNFKKVFADSEEYNFARKLEKEFNYEISFFDCLHITLANKEKAVLITRDEKLIKFGRKYFDIRKPEKFL